MSNTQGLKAAAGEQGLPPQGLKAAAGEPRLPRRASRRLRGSRGCHAKPQGGCGGAKAVTQGLKAAVGEQGLLRKASRRLRGGGGTAHCSGGARDQY